MSWASLLLAQKAPANSFFYQCNSTRISLAVGIDPLGTGLTIDPTSLYLGHCLPSSTDKLRGYFVFQYSFKECGFSRLTSGNTVEYFADLDYQPVLSGTQQLSQPFTEKINCTFIRSLSPTPLPVVQVVSQLSGNGNLIFDAQIMEGDFSGPIDTKVFVLGYPIFVQLSVETFEHLPMQIYVDECTVAPTSDLSNATVTYSLITNHGCFVDGKVATSTFLPRPSPGFMRLSFQAFSFMDLDTDLFLHFKVVVWDPKILTDPSRKACSYIRTSNSWQLLDNPGLPSACKCCDAVCLALPSRRRRDTNVEEDNGLVHDVVVGPIKVQSQPGSPSYEWDRNESSLVESKSGFTIPPAVGALFLEVIVLLVVSLGVALYSRKDKKMPKEAEEAWLVPPDKPEPQKC
ncbi:zona pellucida sperm-binding protein 3-like [Discoglossus pictus]